ncbi:hypothetical protein [Phreatobacter sp.]|uniref:hypothetical protein n=1 Tax=Phreatobacter sp. TaxID=1966341 RepID=UPI0025E17443|nr:hypothetical protein [Phreatobacter sp.]
MDSLFSPAGLIGALIGAGVGWVDYRIVSGLVAGKLRQTDRSTTEAERRDYERRIVLAQRILMVVIVPAFAGLGYWLGRTISGWGI